MFPSCGLENPDSAALHSGPPVTLSLPGDVVSEKETGGLSGVFWFSFLLYGVFLHLLVYYSTYSFWVHFFLDVVESVNSFRSVRKGHSGYPVPKYINKKKKNIRNLSKFGPTWGPSKREEAKWTMCLKNCMLIVQNNGFLTFWTCIQCVFLVSILLPCSPPTEMGRLPFSKSYCFTSPL